MRTRPSRPGMAGGLAGSVPDRRARGEWPRASIPLQMRMVAVKRPSPRRWQASCPRVGRNSGVARDPVSRARRVGASVGPRAGPGRPGLHPVGVHVVEERGRRVGQPATARNATSARPRLHPYGGASCMTPSRLQPDRWKSGSTTPWPENGPKKENGSLGVTQAPVLTCGPYWIRTSGLRIRSPTLYPTELRAQRFSALPTTRLAARPTGGKGGIRTLDTGHPVYWFSKPAPSASRPPFLILSTPSCLAEEEGFEPSEGVNPQRFSRPPP